MRLRAIRFMTFPWDKDLGLVFTLKELGFYVVYA